MRIAFAGVSGLVLATWLGATGCGDDAPADPAGSGGSGASTSSQVSVAVVSSTASTGGGGSGGGDESTSCADAAPMEEFDNNAGGISYKFDPGVIGEPSDQDFFSFEATSGSWYELVTVANPDDVTGLPDTVLTLYAPNDGDQIARNDDDLNGGPDSDIVFRAGETGTYCVKVHDAEGDAGGPSHQYRLVMIPIDFDLYDGDNLDAGDNDTIANSQTVSFSTSTTGMSFTQLSGIFENTSDVDVFDLDAPAGTVALYATFTPSGTSGWGSTNGPGVVNIYEKIGSADAVLHATLDYQDGSDGLSQVPAVADAKYYFEVSYPDGNAVGDNDYYTLLIGTSSTVNDPEQNESDNDESATADTAFPQPNGNLTSHFLGGRIVDSNDVDWWKFEASAGQVLSLACGSRRNGSGNDVFAVEFFDNTASTALESDNEALNKDLFWSSTSSNATKTGVTVLTTGTHYLKLSGTPGAATARHYLCGAHLSTP